MVKYRIKFKAQDERLEGIKLKDHIMRFLQEKYQQYDFQIISVDGTNDELWYFIYNVEAEDTFGKKIELVRVYTIDLTGRTVRHDDSDGIECYTIPEDMLRQFDEVDFEIDRDQMTETGQSISDWV